MQYSDITVSARTDVASDVSVFVVEGKIQHASLEMGKPDEIGAVDRIDGINKNLEFEKTNDISKLDGQEESFDHPSRQNNIAGTKSDGINVELFLN